MKENVKYTIIDLLEDDNFIASANHPTPESDACWTSLLTKGEIRQEDYELALYFVKSLYPNNQYLTKEEIADIWTNVRMQTVRPKKDSRLIHLLIAASAACVLALAGLFLFQHSTDEPTVLIAGNELKIEETARPDMTGDDIQIIFSEENKITLKEKTADIKYNDKGEAEVNSTVVNQTADEKNTAQPETYSQIIIPKGKHTSLTLSDGTKLWLNAFSRIVYPPVFNKDKREIFIEGEAYLEVTPDKERPFIVKTNQMEVRVLGTSFNVS
ncbi:MAG: FecR family protein, partial [Tannerella sp.]|nr:FecR family protein [Tannerella sp.]